MKPIVFLLLLTHIVIPHQVIAGINSSIDKTQKVNSIFFSKRKKANTENGKSEFSNHFTLNKDKYLAIHFTLDQPLIQSLKQLAPDFSEDQLLANGNFQFSIIVDGEVIYVENLNSGAGLAKSKRAQLSHYIPLIASKRIDHWGWFMWLKFMKMAGGQDLLDEGEHVLEIEVRSYVNNNEIKVGALLAKGKIDITVAEKTVDPQAVPLQAIAPNSGWSISKDVFDVTKIETLNKKIAQKRFEDVNGLVVIKNGELLIEEYFNGETRASLHDPRSVGKSIASTVMGIAIEEGHIENEEVELKDFYNLKSYKNYSPAKDAVTLKSLLTMSSGFSGDDSDPSNAGNEEYMYPTSDWVKFALDQPMDKNKVMGKDYAYYTAGVVVLGDVIHKSVPGGLVKYADEKLFAPLGITKYKWQYTPQGVGNTAGGIRLRALDFAKYGQLYKNKGQWQGIQILTENWVEKSLSKQVKQPNEGKNGFYGYLFWNKVYTVDGKDYEVSFCTGNGGNKIFIFKDIPFVVVITCSAYGMPYAHPNADKMMTDYILPAVLANE